MKPQTRAKRLRERGRTYAEIGTQLGVSKATVYRWLNPEFAERSRASARAYKQRQKTSCPTCGGLVGYENPYELCGDCKHERDYGPRNRRITAAWEKGLSGRAIAEQEGLSATQVLSLVQNMRERSDNGPGPSRHTLPHADADSRYERIAVLWNEGIPADDIAAEVGTTTPSLYEMVKRARRKGYDLPHRNHVRRSRYDRGEVEGLWRRGWKLWEIAEHFGISVGGAASLIHRLRQEGCDLPYRQRVAA